MTPKWLNKSLKAKEVSSNCPHSWILLSQGRSCPLKDMYVPLQKTSKLKASITWHTKLSLMSLRLTLECNPWCPWWYYMKYIIWRYWHNTYTLGKKETPRFYKLIFSKWGRDFFAGCSSSQRIWICPSLVQTKIPNSSWFWKGSQKINVMSILESSTWLQNAPTWVGISSTVFFSSLEHKWETQEAFKRHIGLYYAPSHIKNPSIQTRSFFICLE